MRRRGHPARRPLRRCGAASVQPRARPQRPPAGTAAGAQLGTPPGPSTHPQPLATRSLPASPPVPQTVLVEATSGNTGVSLAFLAAARGYRLILCMPHYCSTERKALQKVGVRGVALPAGPWPPSAAARCAAQCAALGAGGSAPALPQLCRPPGAPPRPAAAVWSGGGAVRPRQRWGSPQPMPVPACSCFSSSIPAAAAAAAAAGAACAACCSSAPHPGTAAAASSARAGCRACLPSAEQGSAAAAGAAGAAPGARCPLLPCAGRLGPCSRPVPTFAAHPLSPACPAGCLGAYAKSLEVMERTPGAYMLNQFENAANPQVHYAATGPE